MQRGTLLKFALGALTALIAAFLIYQIPAVHNRLSWRMEMAAAYVGGVINPADQIPTPRPTQERPTATATATKTQAPTLAVSPTPTATLPPTPTPTPIPGQAGLPAPKYEKQDINNCGPASLSTYLRFYGWEGDQKKITDVIKPVREDRNVNVEELAYFVRNHTGWLNVEYRVGANLEQIKQFIAAGIPVVIEEGMKNNEAFWPRDDYWAGHYLFVNAYEDASQTFVTQDTYYGPDKRVSYAELDQNWKAFNRVLIVIYRPELQATVEQILGADWDPEVNRQRALETARRETEEDPQDAFAWFNLGNNLSYFEQYNEAADAFDTARALGLPQRMFRYQFTPFMAYFHAGRNEDLLALTEYALERTPNSEEALLWRGWGLYRSGDIAGAEALFRKALEVNPSYPDAQYALNFLQTPAQ